MEDRRAKEAFGIYIKNLRNRKGYTLKQICEGLCTPQQLSKAEKGEKAVSKLLQDTILERLGVGAEDYEHYLNYDAYDHWEMRQRILHQIVWEHIDSAKELLTEYHKRYMKNPFDDNKITDRLERQFYLSMWVQIRRLEGAAGEELHPILKEAVSLTVPGLWKSPLEEHALSFKELNLILEAEYYNKTDTQAEHYKQIISYIEHSKSDALGMSKIYPKAVFFLCKCALAATDKANGTDRIDETEKSLLRHCNRAIEILRDCARLYYLWELLDMREHYLERMLKKLGGKGENHDSLIRLRQENGEWKRVLEGIYAACHMSKTTISYCYLYMEKGVACINDVVRIRRQMLGMSRRALCQGICDEKTLMRLENKKNNSQRTVVETLLERLGLAGTLNHTDLIAESWEIRRLMSRLRRHNNNFETEKAEAILAQIKVLISADIRCNQQVLIQQEANLQRQRQEIDDDVYCKKIREALELTMPFGAFLQKGEKYLTRQEQICIQNIMQGMDKESKEFRLCMERFEEMCRPVVEGKLPETVSSIYGFVMSYIQSELGTSGEYDQSDRYLEIMLAEELHCYRLPLVARCLYARWWNHTRRKRQGTLTGREPDTETELTNCILLSRFSKFTFEEAFFKEKLNQEKGIVQECLH